jgi:putative membrane protein
MSSLIETAFKEWEFSIWLAAVFVFTALVYLRGWLRVRSACAEAMPAWRAGSFLAGLFLIWVAVGSPLGVFDERFLTVHMAQHLLLMTLAPPLIWLGAPMMPFLHGLPRRFVHGMVAPILRRPKVQALGRVLTSLRFCLTASTAVLIGWHIPIFYEVALRSEGWHVVEHLSFLVTGLLFWWPVVLPWPSRETAARWPVLLYLFLATLPCDVLAGFLVFSERIAYSPYLSMPRLMGISVMDDQQCAGALMWTCVAVLYLIPAAILSTSLLSPRHYHERQAAEKAAFEERVAAGLQPQMRSTADESTAVRDAEPA